jgi:multisubunit Na+/H+ antiporter MnhB subunit
MLNDNQQGVTSRAMTVLVTAGVLLFTAALVAAILSLPAEAPGLYPEVKRNLSESGAESMVTAVLLNFRAYDTLLEIAVLLTAVLGLRAIRLGSREPLHTAIPISPLLMEFVRFLVPVMILLSGYLLWAGSKYPGGAFQAGAVLGAAAILLQVAEQIAPGSLKDWLEKGLLVMGVAVFAALGALSLLWGGVFLEYPPHYAKQFILIIEAAAALSIGVTLMVLFAGRSLANLNDAEIEETEHS